MSSSVTSASRDASPSSRLLVVLSSSRAALPPPSQLPLDEAIDQSWSGLSDRMLQHVQNAVAAAVDDKYIVRPYHVGPYLGGFNPTGLALRLHGARQFLKEMKRLWPQFECDERVRAALITHFWHDFLACLSDLSSAAQFGDELGELCNLALGIAGEVVPLLLGHTPSRTGIQLQREQADDKARRMRQARENEAKKLSASPSEAPSESAVEEPIGVEPTAAQDAAAFALSVPFLAELTELLLSLLVMVSLPQRARVISSMLGLLSLGGFREWLFSGAAGSERDHLVRSLVDAAFGMLEERYELDEDGCVVRVPIDAADTSADQTPPDSNFGAGRDLLVQLIGFSQETTTGDARLVTRLVLDTAMAVMERATSIEREVRAALVALQIVVASDRRDLTGIVAAESVARIYAVARPFLADDRSSTRVHRAAVALLQQMGQLPMSLYAPIAVDLIRVGLTTIANDAFSDRFRVDQMALLSDCAEFAALAAENSGEAVDFAGAIITCAERTFEAASSEPASIAPTQAALMIACFHVLSEFTLRISCEVPNAFGPVALRMLRLAIRASSHPEDAVVLAMGVVVEKCTPPVWHAVTRAEAMEIAHDFHNALLRCMEVETRTALGSLTPETDRLRHCAFVAWASMASSLQADFQPFIDDAVRYLKRTMHVKYRWPHETRPEMLEDDGEEENEEEEEKEDEAEEEQEQEEDDDVDQEEEEEEEEEDEDAGSDEEDGNVVYRRHRPDGTTEADGFQTLWLTLVQTFGTAFRPIHDRLCPLFQVWWQSASAAGEPLPHAIMMAPSVPLLHGDTLIDRSTAQVPHTSSVQKIGVQSRLILRALLDGAPTAQHLANRHILDKSLTNATNFFLAYYHLFDILGDHAFDLKDLTPTGRMPRNKEKKEPNKNAASSELDALLDRAFTVLQGHAAHAASTDAIYVVLQKYERGDIDGWSHALSHGDAESEVHDETHRCPAECTAPGHIDLCAVVLLVVGWIVKVGFLDHVMSRPHLLQRLLIVVRQLGEQAPFRAPVALFYGNLCTGLTHRADTPITPTTRDEIIAPAIEFLLATVARGSPPSASATDAILSLGDFFSAGCRLDVGWLTNYVRRVTDEIEQHVTRTIRRCREYRQSRRIEDAFRQATEQMSRSGR